MPNLINLVSKQNFEFLGGNAPQKKGVPPFFHFFIKNGEFDEKNNLYKKYWKLNSALYYIRGIIP